MLLRGDVQVSDIHDAPLSAVAEASEQNERAQHHQYDSSNRQRFHFPSLLLQGRRRGETAPLRPWSLVVVIVLVVFVVLVLVMLVLVMLVLVMLVLLALVALV